MKYAFRTIVGLGLEVAALVAVSLTIYKLLGVGTCASGGPYVVARECPEGTEWLGLLLPGSIFVGLFGIALYAMRGAAPGSEEKGGAGFAALLGWSGLFLGIAFACFWGVWGPNANPGPGGELGGLIVGFLFVPMGVIPIIVSLGVIRRERKHGVKADPQADLLSRLEKKAPVARKASFATTGSPDKLTAIERLQALRDRGAITQAEFDKLKAEVMGAVNPVAAICHVLAIVPGRLRRDLGCQLALARLAWRRCGTGC